MPDFSGAVDLGALRSRPRPAPQPAPPAAPDPEEALSKMLTPELRDRMRALLVLEESNGERLTALATFNIGFTPSDALRLRFALLLDMIFPEDTQEGQSGRIIFETEWQNRVRALVEEAEKELRIDKTPADESYLAAMAKAANQFVPAVYKKP